MAGVSYPPKTLLCWLYEKTSSRGTQYFQGRLGASKLVILRSQEISESGEPIWELSVQVLTAAAAPPKTVGPQPLLVPAGLSHRPGLLSRKARKGRTARKPREAGSSLTENPVDDLWREGVP